MHDGATSTLMGNLRAGNGDNTGSSTLLLSLLSLQLRKTEGLRHCCNQCCCHQYKSEHRVLNIVLFAIDVTAIICEWERTRLLSLVIVALSCCGQKRRNKGSQICPMSNAKAPTQCNGLFIMTKTLSSSSSPTPPLDHQQFVDRLLTVFMRTAWSWTTFGVAHVIMILSKTIQLQSDSTLNNIPNIWHETGPGYLHVCRVKRFCNHLLQNWPNTQTNIFPFPDSNRWFQVGFDQKMHKCNPFWGLCPVWRPAIRRGFKGAAITLWSNGYWTKGRRSRHGLTHSVLVDRPQIVSRSMDHVINLTTRKLILTTKCTVEESKSSELNIEHQTPKKEKIKLGVGTVLWEEWGPWLWKRANYSDDQIV